LEVNIQIKTATKTMAAPKCSGRARQLEISTKKTGIAPVPMRTIRAP
jgi:hypothetical protein